MSSVKRHQSVAPCFPSRGTRKNVQFLITRLTAMILSTFSWAAVGSVMICPSLSMAQVTPQNRQFIGRPASIRVIQAAFKKHDKSCKTRQGKITPRRNYFTVLISKTDLLKDTEPSSCNTCRTRVKEERGWSDRSRAASQVSRTHCSCDRSLTPEGQNIKMHVGFKLHNNTHSSLTL